MAGGGAAGGFVLRAFESMLKECANKKYATLQSAIQNYLDSGKNSNQQSTIGETSQVLSTASNQRVDHLVQNPLAAEELEPTSSNGNTTTALANAGQTFGGAEAELVLKPLMLAFETKNIKVVELALDCLHKLIEYNHLEGDPGLDGGNNGQLFTDILNMVCRCVDNSSLDSTTLHVLKVFLTAVASTKMRVHGELLLEIFRACCNIALNSKSPINQAMSKAMLTQMLSIIFRRMEIDVASSNSLEPKEACLEHGSNTMVEVASSSDHNEPRMNLDGILFVKHKTDTSLASVEEMQNLVGCTDIKGLEAVLKKALDLEDGENVTRGIDLESLSIGQHDALLLFRALCKMGIKDHSDEVTTKTRVLSLELLQGLLEGVSRSFGKNSQFIDLIKAHLSYALLRASVSQSSVMFQHAAGIFSVLLLRFRENFKVEIGVFFPMIVLRTLDGSDLNQKLSVLQ